MCVAGVTCKWADSSMCRMGRPIVSWTPWTGECDRPESWGGRQRQPPPSTISSPILTISFLILSHLKTRRGNPTVTASLCAKSIPLPTILTIPLPIPLPARQYSSPSSPSYLGEVVQVRLIPHHLSASPGTASPLPPLPSPRTRPPPHPLPPPALPPLHPSPAPTPVSGRRHRAAWHL